MCKAFVVNAVTTRHFVRPRGAALLGALLALLAGPVETSHAREQIIGTMSTVQGPVTLKRPGNEAVYRVAVGDAVAAGDVIAGGAGSLAQVTLADESLVFLSQHSSIRLSQFTFDPKTNRRTAVISVLAGAARIVVYKVRSPESDLTVESDTASVTFDNLGDCIVTAGPGSAEVIVVDQSVRIRNVLPYVVGELRAYGNQKVIVREKQPPAAPITVSPDDRRRYLDKFRSR